MAKLTQSLLKKIILEEIGLLNEDDKVDPQKIIASGKLNTELGNLLKAVKSFTSKVTDDPMMSPMQGTELFKVLKSVEEQISIISNNSSEYIQIQQPVDVKKQDALKQKIVKPATKVV